MTTINTPKIGELWQNNRNRYIYIILSLPKWGDTPSVDASYNAAELEQWVVTRNIHSGEDFTRSMDSFMGTNRNGQHRFTKVA